ncbi:MAG TPA: hypothetical protein VNM16_13600 [Bacillota bacterium]|nr:hypothetical protein [Bacillota bacterium]
MQIATTRGFPRSARWALTRPGRLGLVLLLLLTVFAPAAAPIARALGPAVAALAPAGAPATVPLPPTLPWTIADAAAGLTNSHAASLAEAAQYRNQTAWVPSTWLPGHLFVVYYGNPYSTQMGILGVGTTDQMLAKLQEQTDAYRSLTTLPVQPALDLVATVAQGSPQPDGTYRLRMPASLLDSEAAIAESNHMPLFLDVQVAHSTVQAEVKALAPYLQRPYVELGLDPEFDMLPGEMPGKYFGTMSATDINWTINYLSQMVSDYHLPQKVLIVHQFTATMLPTWADIKGAPGVALVLDMDGFGGQGIKTANYGLFVRDQNVAGRFGGIKLFYTQDNPLFTPAEVMQLQPTPSLVMYQ